MNKGFWIHKNAMDMFIEILKVPYKGPKYSKIKYRCWNKNEFGKPYLIDTKVYKSKIPKEHYRDWKPYSDAYWRLL